MNIKLKYLFETHMNNLILYSLHSQHYFHEFLISYSFLDLPILLLILKITRFLRYSSSDYMSQENDQDLVLAFQETE